MNGLKFTIEVKSDLLAIKTNNIAIEYRNSKSNTESGITATLADIWVHLISVPDGGIQAYAITVEKLRHYTETVLPYKHFIAAGDANSCLWIYKMTDILPEFQRFDHIKKDSQLKALFSELLIEK